jgi:hypothetical protein
LLELPPDKRDVWGNWLQYDPAKWSETLEREVACYPPLKPIEQELKAAWPKGSPVSKESLELAIRAKAEASYALLWASCTRNEKLVLIQLAQEGFVNPKCREIVSLLAAKGLITLRPAAMVVNYTFRSYLWQIERDQVIREWERMEGSGLWQVAGRLIAFVMLIGGVFFLLTQDFPLQPLLLPLVSGSGILGAPLFRSLMAHINPKSLVSAG